MIDVICSAIVGLYNNNSTLKAAMTSLHQEEALQDTGLPYGTFSIDDISADRKLGSHNEVARVRFDIFTEKRSQRADAWAALDAVYHNSALSVDDYATVSMLWETMNFIDSGVENVWQVTCTYKAYLTLL